MADNKIKELAINYTARNFSSIKNELVEYTKRYYPGTFKDFSEASFGALMLDMVSYVGDVLSFYVDYQANESFLHTALEYNNIVKLSRQLGYKFDASGTSYGEVTFFILVPPTSVGGAPDVNYMPVLRRGSTMSAAGGASFILTDDVNFAESNNDIVVARVNDSTGAPTDYAVKAKGRVISGAFRTISYDIGAFKKFRKLEVPGGANVAEIISVFDANGNSYAEVDYLSQDTIYRQIINPSKEQRALAPTILKPVVVPRRFVVEKTANQTLIIFGHGSESDLSSDSIAEPNKTILDLHGKEFITDKSFDPTNLISSDKLGVGPSNTTLTVAYRSTPPGNLNAPVGTVNTIESKRLTFDNLTNLNSSKVASVRSSLEVINEDPIIGDQVNISVDDIKQKAYGSFYAQNRAVTMQDYKSLIYSMPTRFGTISRCAMVKDQDSFKRNLNLYVLCQNSSGFLTQANSSVKMNLKVWLNRYRMINDSIDILDGNIVNLGLNFEILARANTNKTSVLNRCLSTLVQNFNKKPDLGEFLDIAEIYKLLNSVEGVADTINIEVNQKFGASYADTIFDLEEMYSADRRFITMPFNMVYEFKFGTDFAGVVR